MGSRNLFSVALLLASLPPLLAQQGRRAQPLEPPPGIAVRKDLVYAAVAGRDLLLDVYAPEPKPADPLPVVVWIHGGGWRNGSKNNPRAAMTMLTRGYAVVSVGYRLSGESIFPAAIADCKAAVRWVRANAKRYGVDPNRLAVWGSSAGGHLAALLGTSDQSNEWDRLHPVHADYSSKPNLVVNWYGPTDFLRMNDFEGRIDHDAPDSPESLFIGRPIQQYPEASQRANPIRYVTADDPPMLLMHGEKDQSVPYNQSELLHVALEHAGVSSRLYMVRGGDHGFRDAVDDSRDDLTDMVADFLDEHLR